MHAPQIIMLCIVSVNVAFTLYTAPDRRGAETFGSLLGVAIQVGLLYWGGFWG